MLATATHDHKRGEDVRARLAVLSEHAARLDRSGWRAGSPRPAPLRTPACPTPADIAMLLQTIVGAWPLDLDAGRRRRRAPPSPSASRPGSRRRCARPSCVSDWARSQRGLRDGGARSPAPASIAEDRAARLCGPRSSPSSRRIAPAGAVNGLAQTPAAADRARRARPLPGHRVLGFQPGRSRQPPAGRLSRASRRWAMPTCRALAALAGWPRSSRR